MASPEMMGRRTVGVRLTDIDIKIRRRRGRVLYEKAVLDRDLILAMEIEKAIERPSDRIYRVPEAAVKAVMGNGKAAHH